MLKPSQVVVEIFGCDPPVAPQEILQLAVSIVDCLNVKGVAHPLTTGQVQRFVAHTDYGGTGRIGAVTITYQNDILVHDRFDDLPQAVSIDRRENGTDCRATPVSGNQHRNLLI